MRSYDTIIARLIFASMIGLGLGSLFFLFNLFPQYGQILLLIGILIIIFSLVSTIIQVNALKQERKLINIHLDKLQASGLMIFRKKYERLLYSRDVADLPKFSRLIFNFNTLAIIQPISHAEIRQIIQLCKKFSIPIIPRGAGTGGYGGVLPIRNGIIINLSRLNSILEFDSDDLIVEVETGITWRRLREYLKPKGFDLPIYPSSAPSSTVGGWVSSGGYGIGSNKFGDISQNVNGVTLIDIQGENVTYNDVSKIIGNFGSLGIIWKIKLNIIALSPITHLALSPNSLCDGLQVFKELQNYNPYFMRYLDQRNINWVCDKGQKSLIDCCDSKIGIIAVSFQSEELKSFSIEKFLKQKPIHVLSDVCAQELWEDRFYTLRMKRKGPSLIVGEVLVPNPSLTKFIESLHSWFEPESFMFELVSTNLKASVVMVWFPTDLRKWNLPIIGSLPYLISWFKTFQVIRLAWNVNGTTYNNGGLWLSMYPRKENKKLLDHIKEVKSISDRGNIFNPGKIISPRIPRLFPVISWSTAVKISLPILGFLYRFVPKRFR